MKFFIDINCDSKLTPILIILSENSGLMLEGEIKTISLNFLSSPKNLLLTGPIITLAPEDLMSCIALINFFLF